MLYSMCNCVIGLIVKLFLSSLSVCILLASILRSRTGPLQGKCRCNTKLHGAVALVTEATTGIGLETAMDLARRGARVILTSRDMKKSEIVAAKIIRSTGNRQVECRHLNLSKVCSIQKFAKKFNKTISRLDILVNNPGPVKPKRRTRDGTDLVMQINYLGPFLLTHLLFSKLTASRPSRIVNVLTYIDKLDPIDFTHRGYIHSKLCQRTWTAALAKHLPDGVTANSLYPGKAMGELLSKFPSIYQRVLLRSLEWLYRDGDGKAHTVIHMCVAPELVNTSGLYFEDCKPRKTSLVEQNVALLDKVWLRSLCLTEIKKFGKPK